MQLWHPQKAQWIKLSPEATLLLLIFANTKKGAINILMKCTKFQMNEAQNIIEHNWKKIKELV